jgi:predicted esterase
LSDKYSLVLFDYIGFGKSIDHTFETDFPSVYSCKMSLYIVLKHLLESNVKERQISLYGFSIGGAIVAKVVSELLPFQFYKIILSCTFTSLRDIIVEKKIHYNAFYYMIPNELDTYNNLGIIYKNRQESNKSDNENLNSLVLFHSKDDKVIPFHMFKRLSTFSDSTLVISGEHDNIEYSQEMSEYF